MMILAIKIRSFRFRFRKCLELELVERKPELEDRLGETGPAQSAFRDLDSRKVRTPEGIHSLPPPSRIGMNHKIRNQIEGMKTSISEKPQVREPEQVSGRRLNS